jgi:uncharacterized protein
MHLGACTIDLSLPRGTRSLKEKRGILKPLMAQVRKEFNVSVAEVESADVWQSATIAVAIVAGPGANVHGMLEQVVRWIERTQPHLYVTDFQIELL